MTDVQPLGPNETASVEVHVYRDGEVIIVELCDRTEDAAVVAAAWKRTDGIECEVRSDYHNTSART